MAKAPYPSPPVKQQQAPTAAATPEVTLINEQLAPRLNPALYEFQLEVSEVAQAINGAFVEFERSYAPILTQFERVSVEVARKFTALQASFECLRDSITQQFAGFAETLAPVVEEQRIQKRIMDLGFVPHAVLFNHLENVEKHSGVAIDDFSQALAGEIWPKVKGSLRLSMDESLADEKLFCTFDEMIRAHEAGLYQLTAPSAFFVIERAVRLVRQDAEKKAPTKDWFYRGLDDLPFYVLSPQWRRGWFGVWEILREHSFAYCRDDSSADETPFPQRHAAAHGFGTKIYNSVDSINNVLLAHMVITTASVFQAYIHDEQPKSS